MRKPSKGELSPLFLAPQLVPSRDRENAAGRGAADAPATGAAPLYLAARRF